MNVENEDISKKFTDLLIDDKIKSSLAMMNVIDMTPIQARCIPHLLDGKDVLGASKTGSGKTLAFLVPLVSKIIKSGINTKHDTVAIIMSPTRELANQTFNMLKDLIRDTDIRAGVVIGGNDLDDEIRQLEHGLDILVATPGRLKDHMYNRKCLQYNYLQTLIIDEADRLMADGFLEQMKAIINKLPTQRQTALFSATLNVNSFKLKNKMKKLSTNEKIKPSNIEEKILSLAYISLRENCVCIDMSTYEIPDCIGNELVSCTVSQLIQNFVVCDAEDKFTLLCTLLKASKGKKVIVFMSTCLEVKFYHMLMTEIKQIIWHQGAVLALHGQLKQSKRDENLNRFINSKNSVLLCTDVAARGLNIPNIDLVIQYDPPEDHKEYIHRVGRTARAGNEGQAYIFLRKHETNFIKMLHKEKIPIEGLECDKILPIQEDLERIVARNKELNKAAVEAFKTVITAYTNNPSHCFNINTLDHVALGKTFCLTQPPQVHIKNKGEKINTKGKKRPVEIGSYEDDCGTYRKYARR